jgi:acetyltransferase
LFQPATVAVIGASDRPGSVGQVIWRNLTQGGFQGALWPVNQRQATVGGVRAWADVAALPQAPALAVICTPAGHRARPDRASWASGAPARPSC